jgi:hypothetical protein
LFVCSSVPKDCSGGLEEASSAWKCALDWRRLGAAMEAYRIRTEQHASIAGGACGEAERRRRAGAWCGGGGIQDPDGGG